MRPAFLVCLTLIAASPAGLTAQTAAPTAALKRAAAGISAADVRRRINVIADDSMMGRDTPSPGLEKTAQYVADEFKQAGVQPASSGGYLQPVTFRSRKIDEANSSLALVRRGKVMPVVLGDEATFSMRIDPAAAVEAPLVFACHGLAIPEVAHDDFAGLDVKGKVVVYLSGSPRSVPGALIPPP